MATSHRLLSTWESIAFCCSLVFRIHFKLDDLLALQLALVPPFSPAQVHVHGQLPATDDAVPAEQRFEVGLVDVSVL
jgi:hypothetical protein